MLINKTKTSNYNGTSAVKVNGEDKNIMYIYGSINDQGIPSWNVNIADFDLYEEYQEEVDADFEALKQEIINDAKTIKDVK